MGNTRFVFVEGLMGAGKTTTAVWLADHLRGMGLSAQFVLEGPTWDAPEHPLRASTGLPHPFAPWEDLTVDGYIAHGLGKWNAFVDQVQQVATVSVCDGLLFHGNMTDLLLMNAQPAIVGRYITDVLACLQVLQPAVIYFQHPDVAHALRVVRDERGSDREAYQVNWKVMSPYGVQRSLTGFDGLVRLYQDYRALCDDIFAGLTIPSWRSCAKVTGPAIGAKSSRSCKTASVSRSQSDECRSAPSAARARHDTSTRPPIVACARRRFSSVDQPGRSATSPYLMAT